MEEYKITVFKSKNKDTTPIKIPKFLPQPSFRLGIIAPSFSGKSNLIVNMLKKNNFKYNKLFKKNIFLFSKTAKLDDIYDQLKISKNNILDTFDKKFINELMNEQKEIIENGDIPQHILLILDDIITDLKNDDELLQQLFFNSRHYKFSIIITSQAYHKMPKNVRLNLSHIILFKIPDDDSKQVYKELPISKVIFNHFYDECTKEKYCFMYIDLKNKRYFHNFEYELFE